jgi:hypothetical protein
MVGSGLALTTWLRKDAFDPASGFRSTLESAISKERFFIAFEIKVYTKLESLRVEAM